METETQTPQISYPCNQALVWRTNFWRSWSFDIWPWS